MRLAIAPLLGLALAGCGGVQTSPSGAEARTRAAQPAASIAAAAPVPASRTASARAEARPEGASPAGGEASATRASGATETQGTDRLDAAPVGGADRRPTIARGSGRARNAAPPQRRFRVVTEVTPAGERRLRLVEESDATQLPGVEQEAPIPAPPPVEPPPDAKGPPPVIPIPAPR
jgi:hypothetical protein